MRPLILAICLIALVFAIPSDTEAACRGPVRRALSAVVRVQPVRSALRGVRVRPVRAVLRGVRARDC